MRRQSALCLPSADFSAELRRAVTVARGTESPDNDNDGCTLRVDIGTPKAAGLGRVVGLSPVDERADTVSTQSNAVDSDVGNDGIAEERRFEARPSIEVAVNVDDSGSRTQEEEEWQEDEDNDDDGDDDVNVRVHYSSH